ncbi:MAG: AAA family ATPase [Planctomycetes bacterium]|nr:AAA family ATPase [Planctomycetota bacterium]
MSYDAVIGHAAVIERLRGLARDRRIAGAYLFAGPDGVGKQKVAEAFARSLDAELTIVRREEERHEIAIRQVRELIGALSLKPLDRRMRAVLIDEAELLNAESQNALLKTLEEPPERCVFLLVTAAPGLLLPTVASRCHTIRFGPLSDADMTEFGKTLGKDPETSAWIMALARGSPGRAKALAADVDELRERARELFDHLARGELNPVIERLAKVRDTGEARRRAQELIDFLILALREALRARESGAPPRPHLLPEALARRLAPLDGEDLADRIRHMMDHLGYIDAYANVPLVVENALLQI